MFLVEEFRKEGILTPEIEDQLLIVDYYVYQRAREFLAQDDFKSMYRATEISYYLTKRQGDTTARQYLNSLLSTLFPEGEKSHLHNVFNGSIPVGMDGLSGCLLMLVYIASATDNIPLRVAIKEGMRFLISLRRDVDFSKKIYSYFPATTQTEGLGEDKLTWNDSDLAPAVLLYQAALLYQDTALANMAELTGLNTLLIKNDQDNSVGSPNFYQGAAGIAQTYRALYRISAQPAYQEGCTFWTERTVSLSENNHEVRPCEEKENDLLTGTTGIVLSLFPLITSKDLRWDKAVLLR